MAIATTKSQRTNKTKVLKRHVTYKLDLPHVPTSGPMRITSMGAHGVIFLYCLPRGQPLHGRLGPIIHLLIEAPAIPRVFPSITQFSHPHSLPATVPFLGVVFAHCLKSISSRAPLLSLQLGFVASLRLPSLQNHPCQECPGTPPSKSSAEFSVLTYLTEPSGRI